MQDEILAILREIHVTQKEHLAAYREYAAKSIEWQEVYQRRLRRALLAIILPGIIGIVALVACGILVLAW